MQTSVPSWQRPFNVTIFDFGEDFNLVNILAEQKFALSKADAKRMIQNGEVWILPNDSENWKTVANGQEINIHESIIKWKENILPNEKANLILVGGKKDNAICHRIKIEKGISIKCETKL